MVSEGLCEQCLGFPIRPHELAQAMLRNFDRRDVVTIEQIGDVHSLQPDGCAFCVLLQEMLCHSGRGRGIKGLSLYVSVEQLIRRDGTVLPQLLLGLRWKEDPWPDWLSTLHSTSLQSTTQSFSHPINASEVNWDLVRSWLCDCDAIHSGCTSHDPDEQPLHGFQVIDCKTRDIVPLPNRCKYAALSYVWGLSGCALDYSHQKLKDQAPQTIKDAMLCTQALGLEYLWVDRYCIDQGDPRTKHRLIQRMDQVYRNASITIINAAGEGPDCGLPGVSARPRRKQEFSEVHGVKYFTLPCPKEDLAQSSWAKRGWTYQEGLLSRRRIVFSQYQVYFQCLRTHGCEAMPEIYKLRKPNWSVMGLHIHISSPMQGFPVILDAPTDRFELESRNPLTGITDRINEYIGRSLSYESDILNAFMGVLRQAWFLPEPIYHFWGLPFLSESTGDEPTESDVLRVLVWQSKAVASRRDTFPSWTWAGWQNLGEFYTSRAQRLEGGITFEDGDSTSLNLTEYMFRMRSSWNMLAFKPVIYVTGWFAAIQITFEPGVRSIKPGRRVVALTKGGHSVEEMENEFAFAEVHLIDGGTHLESLTQGENQPASVKWPAIMFTQKTNTENSDATITNAHGLLLKEIRGGEFEKVGVFNFRVEGSPPWASSEQSQVDRCKPHEASVLLSWHWERSGELAGKLKAEWRTIKLV